MVLTFGKLHANGATNVIPDEVQLSGTFRTLDEKWRIEAKTHIQRIIRETVAAYGCTVEIDMPEGYPCVDNDSEITEKAIGFAQQIVGKENVKPLEVRMTAEDFGFFSQKYPSCFYRFGMRGKSNSDTGELHSSTFQIDEEGLYYGVSGLTWLAVKFLS
jgi:hippurate hydrolase